MQSSYYLAATTNFKTEINIKQFVCFSYTHVLLVNIVPYLEMCIKIYKIKFLTISSSI